MITLIACAGWPAGFIEMLARPSPTVAKGLRVTASEHHGFPGWTRTKVTNARRLSEDGEGVASVHPTTNQGARNPFDSGD